MNSPFRNKVTSWRGGHGHVLCLSSSPLCKPAVASNTTCYSTAPAIGMAPMDLSLQKLEQAVSLRKRIHQLEEQLNSLFGNTRTKRSQSGSAKHTVSAATRAKLRAAAKARWAKRNGDKSTGGSTKAKKKGGLTPAGRRKLSQLMHARWAAKRRAAGKKK